MSQSALPQSLEQVQAFPDVQPDVQEIREPEEFNYRPIPAKAPVTLGRGLLSAIGLITVFCIPFGLFGFVLGLFALYQIRRAEGQLGGMLIASVGTALSGVFLVSGVALQVYHYRTEIPDGFERVNFSYDISSKQFLQKEGRRRLHPDVFALDQKKIHVKGYMYPTRHTENLPAFLLVKDSGQCCFGGKPKLYDMILVEMAEGQTVDYKSGMVAVAGVFHANKPSRGPAGLVPVYKLDGTFFERARTRF